MLADKRKVVIGLMRSITLFTDEKVLTKTQNDKDELYLWKNTKNIFPDNSLQVIGVVNRGFPILTSSISGKVYVITDNNLDIEPIFIAQNFDVLVEILNLIELAWKGHENENSLWKMKENLDARTSILSKIKDFDVEIDLSFWDWIAFRELTINMF
jgi:hypothetical protein